LTWQEKKINGQRKVSQLCGLIKMPPKERLPKSLKELKVNKSPKHLCYPTLSDDALTGLDFGVGDKPGLDASKKDKRKSFPTWRKCRMLSESGSLSAKIIPFLNVDKVVGVCALEEKRSFGKWRKYSPMS
jgi:hypothetical protein